MKIHFFALIIFFLAICWIEGHAQAVNTSNDPKEDAVNFINNTLKSFNNNIVRFQSLRLGLQDMQPFDPQHLDTTTIFQNMNSLGKYEQFLEAFRQKTTGMTRRVADSVGLLEARLGDSTHWKAFDRFFQSFKDETQLYVQYSLKLSHQVLETRTALIFLQTNGFDITSNLVKLKGSKDAQDQYQTHLNKITNSSNQAAEAFQAIVDETGKSNKIVVSVLEVLSK
jgi:hypothetical protein